MFKKIKKNKGFTLIEILVVIGIIAILAAIVIIAINPARQFAQARNTQRTANVNAILNAVGQYVADNKGNLPTIPNGEITLVLCNELVSTYLPSLPTDPGSTSKGASIVCGIDPLTNKVGYEVLQDATSKRISVCSPNLLSGTDLTTVGSTDTKICVER
jgi:prepilin-type N-terminal cleavage/methylation domain-containing protein